MRILRAAAFGALVLFLAGGHAFAATISVGQTNVAHAGASADVTVSLTPGAGEQVAALQIDLTFDTSVLSVNQVTSGTSADAADKDVSSSTPEEGTLRIIVAGFNQNVMTQGVVAHVEFATATDALTGSYAVTCEGLIVSDPAGGDLPGSAVSGAVIIGTVVTVPNVAGLSQADAQSAIVASNLTVGVVSQEYSATVASGYVIRQDPAANSSVAPGTSVSLVVSKGPQPVTVPNVAGLSQSAAQSAIITVGLVLGTVSEQYDATIAAGIVITQDPAANSSVTPGTAVNLVVSKGPQFVTVPGVAGLSQTDAQTAITNAGLTLGTVSEQYDAAIAAGIVISQDPKANDSVTLGTVVNLVVSKGPQFVTVPGVAGLSQTDAQTAITNASLTLGTVSEQYHATIAAGIVISQEPEANDSVVPGTAVNLVVSKGPEPVSVPNVVGLSQAGAQTAIIGAGLTLGAVSEQYDAAIAAGIVISQDPKANDSVMPGTPVNLVVSKGPEPVTVPNVTGMAQADAQVAITAAGLAVGTITQQSSASVPAGNVINQDPAAASRVASGTAVNLILSKGPQPVNVPNVVGMTQTAAQTAITGLGLIVGTAAQQYDATIPSGTVISQDPLANNSVAPGTAVNLVVSKGPQPVTVPNLAGMSQANAQTAITNAGLTLGTVSQEYSATVFIGVVMTQDPAANSSALPGTPLNITVSKGPQPATVPNVVGMSQANAQNAIANAALAVGSVSQEYSVTVPLGIVISQDPPANNVVSQGTPVNISVSKGPQPVTVPNVAGMTQANAQTAITSAGLVVGAVSEQYNAAAPAGTVIEQIPAANTTVAQGASVALSISKGPAPLSVPDVGGLSETAARAAITAAGLTPGDATLEHSATVSSGHVVRTEPEAGTAVTPGSTVNLVISSGVALVAVPDVTGKAQATAEAAIRAANLVVGNETTQHSISVAAGAVISQTPAGGTFASSRSAVALVVSDGTVAPNVVGLQQSDAAAALTAAGLTVGNVTTESSDTVAAGVVIAQTLSPAALANPGTAVGITVSKGPSTGCVGSAGTGTFGSITKMLGDLSILSFACACLVLHPRARRRNGST